MVGKDRGCRGRQFQGQERAGARVLATQGLVETGFVGWGVKATVDHAKRRDDDSLSGEQQRTDGLSAMSS